MFILPRLLLVQLVVVVAGCLSTSRSVFELDLVREGAVLDPSIHRVRIGERITGEVDLGKLVGQGVFVTRYTVRLATPISPARESPEYLVDTEVELNPPIAVSPGLQSLVRWSFAVTPEMATRTGRYRLSFTFDEANLSAQVSFSVER